MISGTAFTLITALCGLGTGLLVDNVSRKWILVICGVTWSTFTGTMFFCHTFVEVLIPRMIVGAFASACIPASISLINDYFPHNKRARANSFFFFGVYLGVAMSALSTLLDENLGYASHSANTCIDGETLS
jgi:MFS family permease